MTKVSLYIATDIRNPARRKHGGYAWIMQYRSPSGKIHEIEGDGILKDCTETLLVIEAIDSAVSRLNTRCSLEIYTSCAQIVNTCRNRWLDRWIENGFEKSDGSRVKNWDKWESLSGALESQDVTFMDEAPEEMIRNRLKTNIFILKERLKDS